MREVDPPAYESVNRTASFFSHEESKINITEERPRWPLKDEDSSTLRRGRTLCRTGRCRLPLNSRGLPGTPPGVCTLGSFHFINPPFFLPAPSDFLARLSRSLGQQPQIRRVVSHFGEARCEIVVRRAGTLFSHVWFRLRFSLVPSPTLFVFRFFSFFFFLNTLENGVCEKQSVGSNALARALKRIGTAPMILFPARSV